jgi:hypothetical protein
MRPPFSFPQIATGDLNIATVGQLSSTNLPFGDQFEPRPIKVVRFEAAFGRRSLWKQVLENAPGHAHHTPSYSPTPIPNSTTDRWEFQRTSGGKRKNMGLGKLFRECSTNGDMSVKRLLSKRLDGSREDRPNWH